MDFLTDDIDFAAYLKETDAQTKVKPAADFSRVNYEHV